MEITQKDYNNKGKIRKYLSYIFYFIIMIAPIVLVILPVDHFDKGQTMCLSVLLLDIECYACGMTRAIMHLIHFDFAGAWAFNKLAFLVLPLLFPFWLKSVFVVFNKELPLLMKKYM